MYKEGHEEAREYTAISSTLLTELKVFDKDVLLSPQYRNVAFPVGSAAGIVTVYVPTGRIAE